MEANIPAPQDIAEPSVDPVRQNADLPYTVGKWSGFSNYECKACPFSTLDLPVMEEHQSQRHAPLPAATAEAPSKRRFKRRE